MLSWIRSHRILILRLAGLLCAPAALFTRHGWPDHSWGEFALESTGYVLLAAGALGRIWSTLYIAKRKTRVLVTTGPYSICRNPLYLSSLFIGLGTLCIFKNVLLAALVLALFPPVYAVAVWQEERLLAEKFGKAFADYVSSVPRLFPAVWKYDAGAGAHGFVSFDPKRVMPAFGDAGMALLLAPLAVAIEELQFHGILPVLMVL